MYLTTPTLAALSFLPEGKAGVLQTLKEMSRLVRIGKKSFAVHNAAVARTRSCGSGNQKDYPCQVKCLHAYVRDSIAYIQDPVDVERLQTADKTIEIGAGDCDDKSILLAALLESIGHPTRFIAVGFEPDVYSHVYVETKIGTDWTSLETTEDVPAGWEPDAANVRARLTHYN